MRRLIICFSLLTLAIAGVHFAFHHSNNKLASAIEPGAHIDQPHASVQPRFSAAIEPKLSARRHVDGTRPASAPAKQAALKAFAQLPLDFEANRGQAPENFNFVAHGPGYVLGLSPGIASLSVQRPSKRRRSIATPENLGAEPPGQIVSSPLELRLIGASVDAIASGVGEQPGQSNYFIGNDPSKWQRQVPHFNRVKMTGVYPGVDLDYYGNPQQLEYDFLVSPRGDPKNIRLQIQGASRIRLDNAGNAVLRTAAGDVQLKRPVSYQEIAGVRQSVESKFKLTAARELQFVLGAYDRSQPLVIDPVLISALSLGGTTGNQQTEITDVELDATGNVYVTGYTCATDFPSTAGPFQNSNINLLAKTCETAIVTKFDPTFSTMLYSDFIGGSEVTLAWYMAVDGSGNAFVTGGTNSSDFPAVNNVGKTTPLTPCALSKTNAFNCPVGFLVKLSADGSQIMFSELMGGSQASGGHAVELNPLTNEVVVLGATNSSDFQPAPTTLQTTFSGTNCTTVAIPCFESFLYGFDPTTGAVRYGTFLGGANNNFGAGLAVDNSGNIYVAGSTQPPFASALGPVTTTVAPAGGATAGGTDIFVMKLNHSASNVLTTSYITVIQGEADDAAASLALDSSNNAYIIGASASLHLAVTPGVFQSTNTSQNGNDCHFDTPAMAPFLPNACGNAFVAKLTPTGALSFLTYFGGTGQESGTAIGLDSLGNIWLGGVTSSTTGFPFSADAYPQSGAIFDLATPFLAEMSSDGTKVPFATAIASILGQVTSITTDGNANIFVTGFSSAVPITPGVYPAVANTFEPGFVQKWNVGPQPALQLSATNLTFPDTAMGGVSPSQTVTVTNTGAGVMELSLQMQLQQGVFPGDVPPDFVETSTCGTTL
nr:SBBP repeat-containing protein [Candidatus Acidoferrales bacterium]